MAEGNLLSPRRSLYRDSAIRQVSNDDRDAIGSPEELAAPMMSTFGQEFRLMCAICLQDLKQPRQLRSCYHIFCTACLEPFMKVEEMKCPLHSCRQPCNKEDVSKAVSSNVYLRALPGQVSMYVESGNMSCSDASHGDHAELAPYFCIECGQNFCHSCQDNHSSNDDFQQHHSLRLFPTPATTTIGINRRESHLMYSGSEEEASGGQEDKYKCPACRNTDICEHEQWLKDLEDQRIRKNDKCPIEKHAVTDNTLIAYCKDCSEPVCRNCSYIAHKHHDTIDIDDNLVEEKKQEIRVIKKHLVFMQEIFEQAAREASGAENHFFNHVQQMEQEMISRKGAVQTCVEEAFATAFSLIEQTGQKQASLLRQSQEMHLEERFLSTALRLANDTLEGGDAVLDVEYVRVWQGLNAILKGMSGEDDKGAKEGEGETVIPQKIVEKRLILPTAACMNPDLRILKKVGVESTVLRCSFVLKAEQELFLFYSILPLTETEALVACKTQACATSIVQYSNISSERHSVQLKDEGQYSIIAVPGSGIVATFYQQQRSCGGSGSEKRQILFWDQALDTSMERMEAEGAGDKLKLLVETELPPRGVAVTRDNHLVVCLAETRPKAGGDGGRSCIVVMTMRGDILHRKDVGGSGTGPSSGPYFPRYVTVNINGDICVTDEKDRSVLIYSDTLQNLKLRIINPYKEKDRLNNNFCPMGICHDSFGRLIVADANNYCILRIEYNDARMTWESCIIVKDGENEVSDLSSPTLVALGVGPKLWVVCRSKIHVFDYMDTE